MGGPEGIHSSLPHLPSILLGFNTSGVAEGPGNVAVRIHHQPEWHHDPSGNDDRLETKPLRMKRNTDTMFMSCRDGRDVGG